MRGTVPGRGWGAQPGPCTVNLGSGCTRQLQGKSLGVTQCHPSTHPFSSTTHCAPTAEGLLVPPPRVLPGTATVEMVSGWLSASTLTCWKPLQVALCRCLRCVTAQNHHPVCPKSSHTLRERSQISAPCALPHAPHPFTTQPHLSIQPA